MVKYYTTRTLVRELNSNDSTAFIALMTNTDVSRYLNPTGAALERVSAEVVLGHVINSYHSADPVFLFAVVKKEAPETLIGLVSYKQLRAFEAEIFGALIPEFWGKKISNEMVEGLIQYVFENTPFSRIVVYIKQENRSAKALIQKLGFNDEGLAFNTVFESDGHVLSLEKGNLLQ
jgi:RimJ/RimL family protein N-acetyltransferase